MSPHADTDTNMYLERYNYNSYMYQTYALHVHAYSFHNKLKTTYLKGKVNRRVDFLLNVLFRIEEDNFFNYRRKCQHPAINSDSGRARHQRAMDIPAEVYILI